MESFTSGRMMRQICIVLPRGAEIVIHFMKIYVKYNVENQ